MDDLIGEFISVTTESLSVLDRELVKLEKTPGDHETLSNIFRIVHTIKGTCGFLGLPRLEGVANATETVLEKIRERKSEAPPLAIGVVLEALGCIKGLIDHLSQHGQEPAGEDGSLLERLNHFAQTGNIEGGSVPAATVLVEEWVVSAAADDFSTFFKGDQELEALIAEYNAKKGYAAQPALPLEEQAFLPAVPAMKSAESAPDNAELSTPIGLDTLASLMQMVGELVQTRNQLLQLQRPQEDHHFTAPIEHLSRITSQLQEGIMKTCMLPIGNAWSRLARLVRDLSQELGKKIELREIGADTLLDRQLLEMLKDPLTHMVRNACDHGVETSAVRRSAGKPEQGTITLSATRESAYVVIDISDDGRGINTQRVKEKAISAGLVSAVDADRMTEQAIMQLIFCTGFSTAEKLSGVSGRGVGMDAVRASIEKAGGTIELSSIAGKGSKFTLKIPLTLAILPALIVEVCGQKFALPQINVLEVLRLSEEGEYKVESLNGAPVMRLHENVLPLGALGNILRLSGPVINWSKTEAFVAVCKVGSDDFGLAIDRVHGAMEMVVKPLPGILQSISVYSGTAIAGDGSVAMVLSPQGLAAAISEHAASSQAEAEKTEPVSKHFAGFLLFASGKGATKAVPLELIGRLEKIDVSTVAVVDGVPVVQYRGELMQLATLDDAALPASGFTQVIVFKHDRGMVGLVVDRIIDIVQSPYDITFESAVKERPGNMIIDGKTVELVDVARLFNAGVDDATVGKVRSHGKKPMKQLAEA